jgi:hypothetical protein
VAEGGGVGRAGVGRLHEPDNGRGLADLGGHPLGGGPAGGQERRLEDQVLGRVAGQRELGEDHQVGAGGGRLGVGAQHPPDIAVEVPDDRVDLRPREPQPLHRARVAAREG